MTVFTHTTAVFGRDFRAKLRTPWPYVEAMADPLLLLLLFGPLVAALGTMPGVPATTTAQWFVPGILVLMVFTTSAFIGSGLQEERAAGALERMLVTPVSRFALLAGRVLRVVVVVLVQAVIVLAATLPFGLRPPLPGTLLALLLLGLLAGALGMASLTIGLTLRNSYAFWGVVSLVYTPIVVTSGALLPMEIAPDWLHWLSRANPLAHVVEAQRALFAGHGGEGAVPLAFGVTLLLAIGSAALGMRTMARARA